MSESEQRCDWYGEGSEFTAPMRKAYERWLKDPVVVNPVSSDVAECLRPMLKAFNDAELIGDVSQPRFTEDRDAPFPPNHVDDELPPG